MNIKKQNRNKASPTLLKQTTRPADTPQFAGEYTMLLHKMHMFANSQIIIYFLQLVITNAFQKESAKLGLAMLALILQTVNVGVLAKVESSLIPVVS